MSDIYAWLMPNGYVLPVKNTHDEAVIKNPSYFGTTEKIIKRLTTKQVYDLAFKFGAIRLSIAYSVMSLEGKIDQITKHADKLMNMIRIHRVAKIVIDKWPNAGWEEYTVVEFVMKMATSANWYKKSMALDPNAYKTEPKPARLREHMESAPVFNPFTGKTHQIPQEQDQGQIDQLYSGVHFAFTAEQAALYACGKATQDDPPVIIEIEPKGLKQQPDVDAMVDQTLTYYIEDKKKDWQAILQSGKNVEMMAEELYGDVDGDVQNWTMESEASDTADDVIMQQQTPIPPSVILSLIDRKSPQRVISVITQLVKGKISPKMLIQLVGQMRVNNMIDSSRVKAIYQIPWIDLSAEVTQDLHGMDEDRLQEELEERGWHMEGDDIINENGQIVPSYEELIYDQWLSKTPLYENKQMYFKGYTSKGSVWHGTTLSRAKSAYPDLLGAAAPVSAKAESWYKPPFMRSMNYAGVTTEKKDISARISNKYTVAQAKGELKPYYIVKIVNDSDAPIDSLKNKRVKAYSASQARLKFLKAFPYLQDYLNMGIEVEARLDAQGWKNEQAKREQQRIDDVRQKQKEEERIQQMWWNKD